MKNELENQLGADMTAFTQSIAPHDADREYRDALISLAAVVEMYLDTIHIAARTLDASESKWRAAHLAQIAAHSDAVSLAEKAKQQERAA